MLHLTPLRDTLAGQELLLEGREEGREAGEVVGRIRTLQQVTQRPVSSRDELLDKPLQELRAIAAELEALLH